MAVFIDDLDRCKSTYVVELLEGIQTLFREAPVTYIVAADRGWLNACYKQEYEELNLHIHEPGKSLGTLFLEKAFRFSTPMPGIPEQQKVQYWRYLLQLKSEGREVDLENARRDAHDALLEVDDFDLDTILPISSERSFEEQQAFLEEAVVRLATPDILERLEHTLREYSVLLDPNPRAMKRLVNAYSANRALALLSRNNIERHQLVLWTILMARWPKLARYLERNSEMINQVGKNTPPDVEDQLKTLFDDQDVIAVVRGDLNGDNQGENLKEEEIIKCAQMHA